MTKSNYTSGPWAVNEKPFKSCATGELMYVIDGPVTVSDYEDWGFNKQDAALIASAPELLEALIDCREALRRAGATGELKVVDAAIAKARGEV